MSITGTHFIFIILELRIFRQHDSERRQKQFPQLINKLEESDTEET